MLSLNTNVNAMYASQALAQSTRKIENLNKIINKTADAETAVAVTPTFLTAAINGTQFAQTNQVQNKLLVDEADIAIKKIVSSLKIMTTLSPGDPDLAVQQSYIAAEMAAANYNSMNLFNSDFNLQVGPNANDKFQVSLTEMQDVLDQDPENPAAVSSSLSKAMNAQSKINGYKSVLGFVDDRLQASLVLLRNNREAMVKSANDQARADLAKQGFIQQAAQLMLAQANVSAQAVIELIKSAAIAPA
jgi:hypothetical protein